MLTRWPVPPSSSVDHKCKQYLASSVAQWRKAAVKEAEGLPVTEDKDKLTALASAPTGIAHFQAHFLLCSNYLTVH